MMSKISCCILFLFLSTVLFAQVRVYENSKGSRISKEKFYDIRNRTNSMYAYYYSQDTLITFLYKGSRKFSGILSESQLVKIKSIYKFRDDFSPIVIKYYPGVDDCSIHIVDRQEEFVEIFRKSNERITTKAQLYNVYKSNEDFELLSNKLSWKIDEGGYIESFFFPYHFPCFSYVIINNEGKYRGYFGEYSTDGLLKDFNKLAKP